MQFTGRIDTSPFGDYVARLGARLRVSLPEAVRGEAAAVVRRVMQMSKDRSVGKARSFAFRNSFRDFSGPDFTLTVGVGKRARNKNYIWFHKSGANGVRPIGIWSRDLSPPPPHAGAPFHHLKDEDWQNVVALWKKQASEAREKADATVRARGLTKKSWLEILEKLSVPGASDGVPGYVKNATPVNGRSREVGFAHATGGGNQFGIQILNTSGLAIATGGAQKLGAAMRIRRSFFMKSLQNGFYDDARFVARNYPWAKVS